MIVGLFTAGSSQVLGPSPSLTLPPILTLTYLNAKYTTPKCLSPLPDLVLTAMVRL